MLPRHSNAIAPPTSMKSPSLLEAIAPFPSVAAPILVKMKGYPFDILVLRQIYLKSKTD
jgi:hypothetical protein